VGPRDGLDVCGKTRPHRDSIPGENLEFEEAEKIRSIIEIFESRLLGEVD
jgi:hypothetical protein